MTPEPGPLVPLGPRKLPFPLFRLSSKRCKYMLYDIDTVTWLRREHQILGVQIGGMPQFPQQNVFFGLPLELMPEEARLLVERGLAYVVDNLDMHDKIFTGMSKGDKVVKGAVHQYQQEIADTAKASKAENDKSKAAEGERIRGNKYQITGSAPVWNAAKLPWIGSDASPIPTSTTVEKTNKPAKTSHPWAVTPTTASSLVQVAQASPNPQVDTSAATYAVFEHLHDKGYYMSPGLRFGCQLMAYPGDPLRYHSHFLARGVDWDEELDLLDIVGGGRLGTGVKKGYLLGGVQATGEKEGKVRTFCIEWGGI